jgi:hypothetical protein
MPPFINQLLSPESLAKTGYFDVAAVTASSWSPAYPRFRRG